ncbi:MAG: NAD-dependent epimerase/dehydratase family protein [Gemmatimonadota bacterium]|nr:MAG: NAD-dependent epimerase/dehydratase family protein [Gemmatimonadota bacterium]
MNILITGATGFIGRHLLKQLIQEGHHCRCLVRSLVNKDELFNNSNVRLFQGDVTKPGTLMRMAKGIDVAYHLAAAGHVTSVSKESYKAFFSLNVQGTKNIAETCGQNGVKRFIHFSSTAAMGLIKLPKIDETAPCQPKTPYQKSKYESELAAFEAGGKFGMEVIVLRPCMVYGPGGKGQFLNFCRLIKKGIFPRVGLGENLTPIVHVNDVVQAAVRALFKGKPGEIYLIASETSPPLVDIHKFIAQALKIKRPYFYVPLWIGYMGAFLLEGVSTIYRRDPIVSRKNIISTVTGRVFDIHKAQTELSYHPNEDLRRGIQETVAWFQTNDLLT